MTPLNNVRSYTTIRRSLVRLVKERVTTVYYVNNVSVANRLGPNRFMRSDKYANERVEQEVFR